MSPAFPSFVQVLGRAHPLVLHVPIGLFVGLAAVELLILARRLDVPRRVIGAWAWLAAAAALATVASGWVLGHEPSYDGETFERHEALGLTVGALASIVAALHQMSRDGAHAGALRGYRFALFVTAGLLVPTGHFGATLTHGDGFLLEPLRGPASPAAPASAAAPSTYASAIAPILQRRCSACHGESKHRGGLSLHARDAIERGGESGAVLDRVRPSASELLRRIALPVAADDHMPPENKPQPTADELAALEAWILAGAPFEGMVEGVALPGGDGRGASGASAQPPPEPARPSVDALAALANEFVHVETLEDGSGAVWIDFSALGARADDELVARLVAPVGEFVADLTLARSRVGRGALALAAELPALRRLDLRGTAVDDAALAELAGHAALAELVLAETELSDASVDTLLALPALARVFVWHSGLSAEAIARLRAERPALHVEADDQPQSAAIEAETEIALARDLPSPDALPPGSAAASLAPINSRCPISGSPVNPRYAVVHDGRVIGFCCPSCPSEFWKDPEAALAKLE